MNEHQEFILKKWCLACEDWHPTSDFGKMASQRDGLAPRCKKSRNEKKSEKTKAMNLSNMTHKEIKKAYAERATELTAKKKQIAELKEQVRELKGEAKELKANAGEVKSSGNGDAHIAPDCGDCEFYRAVTAINRAINRPQVATKGHQYVIRPDGTVDLKKDTRN